MREGKERSALFKFFYLVFRIIFFPLTALLYVLKHPLWICFLLFIAGCCIVYYPLSTGVKLEAIPEWYKNKYTETKLGVAEIASEHGYVEKSTVKNLQDEVDRTQGKKSENFNATIERDDVLEEKFSDIKKRGGFKRKKETKDAAEIVEEKAEKNTTVSGGLEAILSQVKENAKEEEKVLEVKEEVSKPIEAPSAVEDLKEEAPKANKASEEDEFDLF